MRIAVLSDVHGNLPALRAVLDSVDASAPDAVIVAGDLIGGPDFNETTSLLDGIGAWMILGNMDLDLLTFLDGEVSPEKRDSRQWGFMRWHAQNADDKTIELLRELPLHRAVSLQGAPAILVVHGSPRSPDESIFPDKKLELLNTVVAELTQPVLVCGHIHVQWSRRISGKLVMNPGAVSGPLQGDSRPRFSILTYAHERWSVEPKAVAYDVGELRQRYHQSGLYQAGGAVSRAFLIACETGVDVARPLYRFALQKADNAALGSDEFIPDDVWLEAEKEFPWRAFADRSSAQQSGQADSGCSDKIE